MLVERNNANPIDDESSVNVLLRDMPEWENLRRQICPKALQLFDVPTFDFREMLYEPRNLEMAASLMWQIIKPLQPQVLIGPGFCAAPMVFAVGLISVSKMPLVSIFTRHDIGLSRDCFDAKPPYMWGSYPPFVEAPRWWRLGLHEHPD